MGNNLRSRALLAGALGLTGLSGIVIACGGPPSPPQVPSPPQAQSTVVTLPSNVRLLFPDNSWLPPAYQDAGFSDPVATIQKFVSKSLDRDAIPFGSVVVSADLSTLTINGSDGRIAMFGQQLQTFLDAAHANQAIVGANACKASSVVPAYCTQPHDAGPWPGAGCWDPDLSRMPSQPWAPFLPLGMAMLNQRAVLLLDYPPDVSLIAGDYLDNNTMKRFGRVVSAASGGNVDPTLYETIVDVRPIAAPGSGEDTCLPDPIRFYDTADGGARYISPMLGLLLRNAIRNRTRPLAALGSPAQGTWSTMIGQPVNTLSIGYAPTPGNPGMTTPWIGGNHPIAAVYQCCANDTGFKGCQASGGYPAAYQLVSMEQQDLIVGCYLEILSMQPELEPTTVLATCEKTWGMPGTLPPAGPTKHQICIQAKLDDFDCERSCCTKQTADGWCTAHGDDPCAWSGDADACTGGGKPDPKTFCKSTWERMQTCPVVQ